MSELAPGNTLACCLRAWALASKQASSVKRVRSIDSMRCALFLLVHAQALRCLRTHALRGKALHAAAAVDLDAANAKATQVWADVAVAAPELAPDTRPFGDGAAPAGLRGTWYVNGLASCRV